MKAIVIIALAACLTGCQNFPKKLEQWDKLGIVEAEITGKFSHTTYSRAEEAGVITSTLEHNNPWVPKVYIKRVRPAAESADK